MSSTSHIGNLAHSILETIEKSPGTKRKASPVKKSPIKKAKVDDPDSQSCSVIQSTVSETLNEPAKVEIKDERPPETSGLEKSLPDVCGVNSATDVNGQSHANRSEMKEELDRPLLLPPSSAAVKGKKKPPSSKKTAKKKKSTKKKSSVQMDDEEDFSIDPRLGGSKIKNAVKKKGKDSSKSKAAEVDSKKARISELRFPYIHIEGAWNLPQVVKIVNGHVKVSVC